MDLPTKFAIRKPRVLLAGTQDAIDTVRAALGDLLDYICADSVETAIGHLDRDLDLILCNVRFDESRMFDFLRAVRERDVAQGIPVVCIRAHDRPLSPGTHDAIEAALREFDTACFVDLYSLSRESGGSAALAILRNTVFSRLKPREH